MGLFYFIFYFNMIWYYCIPYSLSLSLTWWMSRWMEKIFLVILCERLYNIHWIFPWVTWYNYYNLQKIFSQVDGVRRKGRVNSYELSQRTNFNRYETTKRTTHIFVRNKCVRLVFYWSRCFNLITCLLILYYFFPFSTN